MNEASLHPPEVPVTKHSAHQEGEAEDGDRKFFFFLIIMNDQASSSSVCLDCNLPKIFYLSS